MVEPCGTVLEGDVEGTAGCKGGGLSLVSSQGGWGEQRGSYPRSDGTMTSTRRNCIGFPTNDGKVDPLEGRFGNSHRGGTMALSWRNCIGCPTNDGRGYLLRGWSEIPNYVTVPGFRKGNAYLPYSLVGLKGRRVKVRLPLGYPLIWANQAQTSQLSGHAIQRCGCGLLFMFYNWWVRGNPNWPCLASPFHFAG